MKSRGLKLTLAFATVIASVFITACGENGKSSNAATSATSARAAFDNCITRTRTKYPGYGYENYCYNVQGYNSYTVAQYLQTSYGYIPQGIDLTNGVNNYFSAYVPQLPQQEIDSLVSKWNALFP